MTSEFDLAREDFGKALYALQPYAKDLLVIGGMAPILYRLVPGFAAAAVAPIATREVDWSTPPRLPTRGEEAWKLLGAEGLAYAFDVASLCRPVWHMQADVRRRAEAQATVWAKWLARAGRELDELFNAPTAAGPVEAARIFRAFGGRAPDENEIHLVMSRFVAAVF